MALATATITYNLSDLVGSTPSNNRRRWVVWATTNVPSDTVIDTEGNEIRLGSGDGEVDSSGVGSIAVWIPGTGSNPASWQTYIHVKYPVAHTRGNNTPTRTFGPFTITASGDLADLVDEQEIPPEYAGQLVAEMEAIRDDQIQIAGIDSTDSAVAALVETAAGPLTQAALSATYAPVFTAEAQGAVGDGTTDDGNAIRAALTNATAATAFGRAGRVVLKSRRYGFTGDLAPASGVSLEGTGQRLWSSGATTDDKQTGTMLVPLADSAKISIEGTSGSVTTHKEAIQLKGFTIDGASTTTVGIKIWNALDVTLDNVFVRACVTGILAGTTTATDYIENLRLRDVKITNGTVGIDSTGSASKVFIDAQGLHVRNMTQAAVRGAYSGSFVGGFVGRIGVSGAFDGKAFDFVNGDTITLIGIPVENSSRGVVSDGQGYGINVLGCIFSASDANFGLVKGVDLVDCDGWSVVGSRFSYANGDADAIGIHAQNQARYGYAAGNQYQSVTGVQKKVQVDNPSLNTVNVEGRWTRLDVGDSAYVGDGTGTPILGLAGAAATARTLVYYTGVGGTAANQRWHARANATAEGGSNAGSDYELVSYTDAGSGAVVRMRIRRSDGRVTVFAPLQTQGYATGSRPTPSAAGIGGTIFDTTLNKPIWSTGSAWVDATGAAV